MNRRTLVNQSIVFASFAVIAPPVLSQPFATSESVESGVWENEQDSITVEYDPSLFASATEVESHGATWLTLTAQGTMHLLSIVIMRSETTSSDPSGLRDYVENDPDLHFTLDGTEIVRVLLPEGNGAFGVLYQPVHSGEADLWSYIEFYPSPDGKHNTIELWLSGKRSQFVRESVESAISSISVNDEDMIRAIPLDEMLDAIEALEVSITR